MEQLAPKIYEYKREREIQSSLKAPTNNFDANKINEIVEAAGGSSSTLTLTLLWTCDYDYDLGLECEHGKLCHYNNKTPCTECNINLDVDMQNHTDRPAGATFMVENLTIEHPANGHLYKGYVDNYSSPNNRPGDFDLILRTRNQKGEQVIIREWHVSTDTSSSCPRKFEFEFTWQSDYSSGGPGMNA